MSKTGFYKGRLGIGLTSTMGMGDGNPRYPLDINGDIRLTGAIVNSQGLALNMVNPDSLWAVDAASISYTTGNVGIGTTSPLSKLQIDMGYTGTNGNPTANNAIDSNIDGLYITKQSSAYPGGGSRWGLRIGVLHNSGDSYIQVANENTTTSYDLLLNPNGGNVGIGTTSPEHKLDIRNPDDCVVQIYGGGANKGTMIRMSGNNNAITEPLLYVGTHGSPKYCYISSRYDFPLVFLQNNSEVMRLHDNGNVGIGTLSPSTLLVVGEDGGGHATNVPGIHMKSIVGQAAKCYVVGQDTTHNVHLGYWANSTVGNGYGVLSCYDGSNHLALQHSGGNVGIGTTSPLYKLEVKGGHIGATYDSDHNYGVYMDMNNTSYARIQTIRQGVGYNYDLALQPNGGKVGIGTTSPLCALHIERPLPTSSYPMTIPSANSTSFGIGVHQFLSSRYTDGNSNQYGLVMGSDGTNYYLQHMSTNHNNYYALSLNPKGGNVGIGTTSPGATLDVKTGTNYSGIWLTNEDGRLLSKIARSSQKTVSYFNLYDGGNPETTKVCLHSAGDSYLMGGNFGIGTTSPGQKLEIKTGTSYDGLILNNEDGGLLFKAARSDAKGRAYMSLYDGNTSAPQSRVIFRNDDDSYINTGGNFGIGTTTPENELQVNGRIGVNDGGNGWKLLCGGGLGVNLATGSFTTPGSLGTYYRCEFPGSYTKWTTLWVGRGTHDDSSWRGAFAFKIMYHGAGYGHFNSGEWRVLGYDNDTRTWIAKVGDSYTQTRLYLWLQGGSTYQWAGDGIYHYTTSSSDTVTSGTMPTEWDASVSTSDDRIKHNEKNIDGLKVINKLNPMRYFKTNKPYSENFHFDLDNSGNPITDEPYTIETGLIAQEVRKIPELEHLVYGEDWYDLDKELEEMRENGEDIPEMDLSGNHIDMSGNKIPRKLQLRYKDIFVYNIAATQELYKENQELKTEVATLKSELAAIKQHLGI